MKKTLLIGALVTAALLPAGESRAYYEGPWCAVVNDGAGNVVENCSMRSFEMCRQEALLGGPTGFCRINGRFPGYWAKPGQPHKVKHKRRHRSHHRG
jgi:hypothetical protein